MKSGFSADDSTDSFWPPPPPSPPLSPGDGMTRSQSDWAFQMLLEEISSVPAGSSISSSSATDNAIGRSYTQVRSESSVSRTEEASSNVVEMPKPSRNGAPSWSVEEMDPNYYQAILKSKLELACAAVALRVRLLSISYVFVQKEKIFFFDTAVWLFGFMPGVYYCDPGRFECFVW